MTKPVFSTILIYALALAAAAFALQWLEYRYFLKNMPTEIYIALLATLFVSLGIWVGYRLTSKQISGPFERNDPALKSLGISDRELEVLEALAQGQSNKEIARTLGISPNTIKTHVAHLFEKLAVDRRVLAIEKAKSLRLIP
ncbi:response regulator transcription factor [Parasphingorhabdus sp.]|jgi:DNA-binding NarL/FixJ family response regulator|uniref:response regulator transcription factor n=1 Tax=Parasphingorhabdus sp. TaxID=2709688 RepID=UPI003BB11F36